MSGTTLSFFTVFDKFLIVHLMARLSPRDLTRFGMVCHLTRSYYHQYVAETIVPEIHKGFVKDGKGPKLSTFFIDLAQGLNVDHFTPFPDVPKMTDLWRTDMNRVVVFQSMCHAQKQHSQFYIDKPPTEGSLPSVGVIAPAKGTHPPKGLPCSCVPRAFAPEEYYHQRPPFRYSCLLKEASIVYFTSDCVLPLPGLYECWVQLYFFTDSRLPFLNIDITCSESATCESLTKRIDFVDAQGKACVGCSRTKVALFNVTKPYSHAVLRLFNLDVLQGPYARVAFDYVMYVPVQSTSETTTRKRKFRVLE